MQDRNLNEFTLKKKLKMLYEFLDILQENASRLNALEKHQKQNNQADLAWQSKNKLHAIEREMKKVQQELDELKSINKVRQYAMFLNLLS